VRLLALDSAGSRSSVVVWRDGTLLAQAASSGAHHGEQLLALVEQCLASSGLALAQLDAIACGRGPGAFTGVRLAVATAQGLAYAARCGVIPVSNLQATAERAARLEGAPARLLVCHDARMQEVYWAACEADAAGTRLVGAEAVAAPAAVSLPAGWELGPAPWGVGTAFDPCPAALEPLAARLARRIVLEADAEAIACIAARMGVGAAVDPEQAAPLYLRDDVVRPAAAAPAHVPR
jgi:tRNA threonylcarbamoyladenosine biosynthesis protein TsaB